MDSSFHSNKWWALFATQNSTSAYDLKNNHIPDLLDLTQGAKKWRTSQDYSLM
jgi:hypothetical protein